VPSFPHSAIAAVQTGENYLTLDPDYYTEGALDALTGDFSVDVYTRLQNDHYEIDDTIVVIMEIEGTIDPVTGHMLASVDGFTFDDEPGFVDP
jgi:hypothetical protein